MNHHVLPRTGDQVDAAVAALAPFKAAGYELFPLSPGSKAPRDKGWRTADYGAFDVRAHLARGGNVGVRLADDDLVLDIDPRHGGDVSLQALAWDIDQDDLDKGPRVRTGGGGLHIYLKRPAGRLRGKLDGYPGVDVKTAGGFVVAPGSVHPETGKLYDMAEGSPPIADTPKAPDVLLQRLWRPEPAERSDGGGQMTATELAELLAVLDPAQYRDYDAWLRITAACHDAVGGDPEGMYVWLDWCTRDEAYAGQEDVNEGKWNTFESGKGGGATFKTLLRAVVDAGHPELVARFGHDAADGFDDDYEAPGEDGQPRPARYKRYRVSELLNLPAPVWTVEGILLERSLAVLYGEPKAYKTFIGLDLALCIATGLPYHGKAVQQGRVCYVGAEGHAAELGERVLAWCLHHKVEPEALDEMFSLVLSGVRLDEPASVKAFIKEDAAPYDLIVFDTLNRSMAGNENDTQDVTKVIAGVDYVRRVLRTAVMLVHHSGVNAARERGSTVLRGALDTRIRVQRGKEGLSTLLIEDQRSGPSGLEMNFRPRLVVVDGETLRSTVVMEYVEVSEADEDEPAPNPGPKYAHERILVRIVEEGSVPTASVLWSSGEAGMSKANVNKALVRLRAAGLLQPGEPLTATPQGLKRAGEMGAEVPE